KHTYPRAIQMVQNGIVDVRSLVTHRFPLSEFKAPSKLPKKETA
ncbi:hypothetical protein D1BOALGB6SA_1395, partial [Olavius sp. associated proteobacterium Delta 1]